MQRDDPLSREHVYEKIVEWRISQKRLGGIARADSVLIKDLVMQTVATLGEKHQSQKVL